MADQKIRRKILFLTNIERGEANVIVATAHAVLQAAPDVDVHFATFVGTDGQEDLPYSIRMEDRIITHEIKRPTNTELVSRYLDKKQIPRWKSYPRTWTLPLGYSNTLRALDDVVVAAAPMNGPQLVETVSCISDVICAVAPDLVVVNTMMTTALTACRLLEIEFICLSPKSIKMFAGGSLSLLDSLCKFPAPFSGYSYPIPLHLIPCNVIFYSHLLIRWFRDIHHRHVEQYFEEATGSTVFTIAELIRNKKLNVKILVGTLPELDFPVSRPENVYPCGPIVHLDEPIAKTDPELSAWLSQGTTMYINLGPLCSAGKNQTVELAQALKITFDALNDKLDGRRLQVLWKLKMDEESAPKVNEILGRQIGTDQIRIVDWVEVPPISILETGHIACSVHHGGANSYHEAVIAGIPQVVLPQWGDCYDYAELVELHGIGRHGSRRTKPRWTAGGLSHELLAVLRGDAAKDMKQKAEEMAMVCRRNGDGAGRAATIILESLRNDIEVIHKV